MRVATVLALAIGRPLEAGLATEVPASPWGRLWRAANMVAAPHPAEAARAVVTLCTALVQWFRPHGRLTPEEVGARYVEIALDVARARR